MTLIETQPGESLDEFRVAVDDILTHLWDEPRAGWWHPYEVRDTYRIAGVTFRHFSCIAGSVEALLFQRARNGMSRRLAILPDSTCVCVPTLVENGTKIPIDPSDLEAA